MTQPGARPRVVSLVPSGTKDPDVAAIVELAPDLVVMCIEENRREDADALAEAGVVTAALSIDSVSDVAPALRMLSGLVGVAAEVADVEPVALVDAPPLRAFVPIWKRPWMTISGGTYGSSLLAAIGVANVFADAAERYPTVTLDEVRARRPDVVLAPSEALLGVLTPPVFFSWALMLLILLIAGQAVDHHDRS